MTHKLRRAIRPVSTRLSRLAAIVAGLIAPGGTRQLQPIPVPVKKTSRFPGARR